MVIKEKLKKKKKKEQGCFAFIVLLTKILTRFAFLYQKKGYLFKKRGYFFSLLYHPF